MILCAYVFKIFTVLIPGSSFDMELNIFFPRNLHSFPGTFLRELTLLKAIFGNITSHRPDQICVHFCSVSCFSVELSFYFWLETQRACLPAEQDQKERLAPCWRRWSWEDELKATTWLIPWSRYSSEPQAC